MRERIENKINEYIESILSKEEINRCDYMVLSSVLYTLKSEEATKESNQKMLDVIRGIATQ